LNFSFFFPFDFGPTKSLTMHAATDEDENTKELKFGDINFDQVQTLTNDEMYYLLTKRQDAGHTNE
jgi:hypothetical protein